MTNLANPHDHFFRATFGRVDVAADFVRHYLPSDVVAHLELDALHAVKASFVDDELRDHFTDLLYRTHLQDGTPAYVYLLFEHKSYPEPWVAFQLLRYMVRIWEYTQRQQRLSHLPPLIPLVVYHGETAWQVAPRFRSLVAAPAALVDYVPDFQYEVYDLSAYSDTDLVGAANVQVTLWVLKHIFDAEWQAVLPQVMALLAELARAESGLAYVELVLRYLVAAARSLGREVLVQAVEKMFPETGGALMETIAQTWLEEGVAQGLAQGIRQGLLAGIELGLELKFGAEGLRLWPEIAKLEDVHLLQAVHEGLKTVDTLEELRSIYHYE